MKIIFAGTPEFAAGYLEALIASEHEIVAVISQPDKPGKRGKKLVPSAVKRVATASDLPVLQPTRLTLEDVEAISCDLMIVVAYGQILKQAVLDHPKHGCINVHASILPRWRGAAPVQRAILSGDAITGVTLIQMDAGLDTGDMLAKAEVTIDANDNAANIFAKLGSAGHPLLIRTLTDVAAGELAPEKQDSDIATYAHKIEKDEAHLDWSEGALLVDRAVRAFCPDPVAFTYLGDMRVRIHEGEVVSDKKGRAGLILDVSKKGVLIGCGHDAYLIKRIQLPVGKGSVLNGADVLNGRTDLLCTGNSFATKSIADQ